MAEALVGGFENHDGKIWLDGRLIDWRDAKVHVLTHALHYASAVFEGARTYDGEIFALKRHCDRLRHSAEVMGFEIPWTSDEIAAACRATVQASGEKDVYVRPIAWRGSEQMGVAAQNTSVHLAIACWPWGAYFGDEALQKGLRLEIAPWRRPAPYTAPTTAKATGLYMICTLSKHHANARGFDDGLMLDWRGRVAESTGSNVFFVQDGELHTPVPDCFLNGITRQTVIRLAQQQGIKVIERPIWPEDLEGFEQCFLTGSAAELTPVGSIGPWNFEVGALTRKLMADYGHYARTTHGND